MDLFKTFNVQLYVIENSALKVFQVLNIFKLKILNFHLNVASSYLVHFGYASPPFIEQHRNKIITMRVYCI
ncbi:conserved hypothetical protein, partial [Trichinella spiralis]|uniref:hypothetical protein n=1 Tax=Trichinella spiralis TaxID=6334 RepID=UPI0001EFE199